MADDAKGLLRRFYEEMSAGNLAVIDELVADDMVEHEEFPGVTPDKEGVKQVFATFRAGFPDLRMEPHEMVAEGDMVCARITISGTHQGEFMGMPPTGRRMEVDAIDLLRLRDGQMAEHWGVTDAMAMMQQLGAIPEQAPA